MTPRNRPTTLPRIVLALAVLWLLPSYLMGAVFLSQPNPWFAGEIPPTLLGRLACCPSTEPPSARPASPPRC